jgi:hypothetical protein
MAPNPRRAAISPTAISLDDATVAAAEILSEAIRDARTPGANDFVIITGALQRAIEGRKPGDLMIAGEAFDQLDGALRADIAERAVDRAENYRRAVKRIDSALPPIRPSVRPPVERAPVERAPKNDKPTAQGAPLIAAMAGVLRRRG